MKAEALIGTWLLESFTVSFPDGRPDVHPFGSDGKGQIVYSADGHMAAVLTRGDRAPLSDCRGLEDGYRADATERAAAFNGYMSYAGRYRIEGDLVHHDVAMSMVPNAVGQTVVRRAALHDGQLELTYERKGRNYRLTWRRP